MRLGLSSNLQHESPKQWAEQLRALGCRAVVFPANYRAPEALIADYLDAARENDLLIAEVGIWKNVFAVDAEERRLAREYAIGQLRLADEIGAGCAVNIAGTSGGPLWDGGYRCNLLPAAWDAIVEYTRELLDAVHPTKTKYAIEQMPWMYPTSPDECLKLQQAVDREGFGMHLDIVNMVNCPQRYFFLEEFVRECFDKLGDRVLSCHLKDIRLRSEYTFQLVESPCGEGTMPIETYARLATKYNPDMPMIIEHLSGDDAYRASIRYVRERLSKAGIE